MNPFNVLCVLIVAVCILFLSSDPADALGRKPPGEGKRPFQRLVIPGELGAKELPEPESDGARLFARFCSQCHNLPNPKMYSTDEWPFMFNRMIAHARTMQSLEEGFVVPDEDEKERIIEYLKRNGLRALPEDHISIKTPKAFQFVWFCSTCHSLPDPSQHTSEEWKKVVDRMERYRTRQGREAMTESEKRNILEFLTGMIDSRP